MSHTSTISSVKIASIAALEVAIANLNSRGIACSLTKDATPRAFYPDQPGLGKAEYVVNLPGAKYDVGLYLQPDGTYQARTDFWSGSVEQCLGGKPTTPERAEQAKMGLLFQEYNAAVTMEASRRKGLTVQRRLNSETGRITLELTGNAL